MNQEQHKADAEAFTSMAAETLGAAGAFTAGTIQRDDLLREAAVHASIAHVHAVLATIPDPPEVRPRSLQTTDGFCACSYLSYQHRVTPMCNTTPMPPPPVTDEKVKAVAERGRDRMIAEGRVIGSVPSDGPGQ